MAAQPDGTYKVTAGDGPVAQTWSYLDPEDANRLTQWATGLSILVRIWNYIMDDESASLIMLFSAV